MHALDQEINPVYVKWGMEGYGPDLEPDEQPLTTLRDVLEALVHELGVCATHAVEDAVSAAGIQDYERAYQARVLADELDAAALNVAPSRFITAPLFRDLEAGDLSKAVWLAAAGAVTQRTDLDGRGRIYIMDATA